MPITKEEKVILESEKEITITGENIQITNTFPFDLEKFVAEFHVLHKDSFEELARR